jgi:hypothetical protein
MGRGSGEKQASGVNQSSVRRTSAAPNANELDVRLGRVGTELASAGWRAKLAAGWQPSTADDDFDATEPYWLAGEQMAQVQRLLREQGVVRVDKLAPPVRQQGLDSLDEVVAILTGTPDASAYDAVVVQVGEIRQALA